MEDINDCYELIKLIANKNQQGFLSPGQFNRAWASAELQLFRDRQGAPEPYRQGRPPLPLGEGAARKVADDLDRFVARDEFRPTAQLPYWSRPKRLVHLVSLLAEFEDSLVDVEEVEHRELGTRLRSLLLGPSLEYPIAVLGADQLELYPPTVPRLLITYRRYPVVGKWVGKQLNGRLLYDPAASRQPEWVRDTWNELSIRALTYLGINLKAQDVQQFAELKQQQGT